MSDPTAARAAPLATAAELPPLLPPGLRVSAASGAEEHESRIHAVIKIKPSQLLTLQGRAEPPTTSPAEAGALSSGFRVGPCALNDVFEPIPNSSCGKAVLR